jgi:hypothetical protein
MITLWHGPTARTMKRRFKPVVATCVLGLVLALPGAALAQASTPPGRPVCIPNETDGSCLPTAPESALVDRDKPTFSNPTVVTNPLFPISDLHSVLMLGRVDRLPFRTEVTLLPETKTIEVDGRPVEVLVSQYVAFLDGRIHEVAIDWYAQADDGSVWYFGEDVFNYEDGVVADNEGTWQAGKDGPPAMIMPGDPRVGNVYRSENIPGVAYEEVTVKSTEETVNSPQGPVEGAMVGEELHQDGDREEKIFAPGYGEYLTGQGGELEALALAVPTNALTGSLPAELEGLTTGARDIFDAAESGDWAAASAALDAMIGDWDAYKSGDLPPIIEAEMSDAFVYLVSAVDSSQPAETRQAAIDVARISLDFQLQYRPIVEIDRGRFLLWTDQLQLDAALEDVVGVAGDVTSLEWTWDRFAHAVDGSTAEQVETLLANLRSATDGEDLAAAAIATELGDLLGADG